MNTHGGFARSLNGAFNNTLKVDVNDVVLISEYTGGGFGSKIPGSINMMIPALLSKKANAPGDAPHHARRGALHRPRAARHSRRASRSASARMAGSSRVDSIAISRERPVQRAGRRGLGRHDDFAGLPARSDAVALDGRRHQHAAEDVAARAGRHAGRRHHGAGRWPKPRESSASIRSPSAGSTRRKAKRRSVLRRVRAARAYVTSCFIKEALDKGAERSTGKRRKRAAASASAPRCAAPASRCRRSRAAPVGLRRPAHHQAGRQMQFQSGIGNHGTHSVMDVHRVAAEILGMPWEQCESSGATRPRTCRRPASRPAARRRTR